MDAQSIVLIGAALVTSIVSGTMGMAGGILLLAVMAEFFAPTVLIPLHGIVQFASNGSRTLILFKHIRWNIAAWFAAGALVGALFGSQLVVEIPKSKFQIGIGVFILLVTFAPRPKVAANFKGKWLGVGGMAGFLSLFVGATGPLIAPFFLREGLPKEALVATKAACQAFAHLFKIGTYAALGFLLQPYLGLVLAMVATVFLGNYLGKQLLARIPEAWFVHFFKILIVVLAVRLIWKGYSGT
ncbi:MAG: sulfite exporter TauE/SafE family protein [Bdellovibrionales bacterium]|nr:sulfite exporter TauE/SafE family protein [Bdellovibrionales bacterium]